MIRVGVVADTHSPEFLPELPRALLDRLRGVDLILHAGDVGGGETLRRLRDIAPVEAVRGDHDGGMKELPRCREVAIGGRRVVLVHLAGRIQGLIVPRGNPGQITRLEDLVHPEVRFVNRQRGSGTRVLLDYHLRREGIPPEAIAGYEREEYTHLAVAADVASGAADAGLGILAAARSLGLEFVPLFQEHYQLVIPREHYTSAVLAPLLEIIRDPVFQAEVDALGGYDTSEMGRVVWES